MRKNYVCDMEVGVRQTMGIIKFDVDIHKWILPIALELNLVGNNHRPYNFMVRFLCFSLIVCIDEDAR